MTVARVAVVLVLLLVPTAATAKPKGAKASAKPTGCEDGASATILVVA